MTTPRERVADAAYAAGWLVVRALPERLARWAFDRGADLATRRGAGAQLRRNLARVRPGASATELDDLVRAAMRSYARYWREAFRLPSMDKAALLARLDGTIEGLEHFEASVAAGKGTVVALPHSGNWDVAGVWLVGRLGRFTTVAERLRPESLFRRFVAYRESLGFEIVPLTGGEPVAAVLQRRLAANEVVCLVADRDLTSGGARVEFFGETTKMPVGPAKLAERTGAALLPVGLWFTDDGGWGFRVHPRVDAPNARAATQAVADAFAADIAEHPADWHMLQPFWLADVPPRARRRQTGGSASDPAGPTSGPVTPDRVAP